MNNMIRIAIGTAFIIAQQLAPVHAFVAPLSQISTRTPGPSIFQKVVNANDLTTSRSMLPSSVLLSDGVSAATSFAAANGADGNASLGALRTFFIVLSAAVFGLAALTFITAAVIVPKAAEQLEEDTKRLRPGLWEEYEAKLDEGEVMAMRPDLLQELGNVMQPIIISNYEEEAEKKYPVAKKPSEPIDATVVEKTKSEE